MEPLIPMGSVVLAAAGHPGLLRPGDVVSLQAGPEHAVFTHRVIRLATLPDGLYIETKGDANPAADPALIAATDVIGRVELSVPYAGYGVAAAEHDPGRPARVLARRAAARRRLAARVARGRPARRPAPATVDGPRSIGAGSTEAEGAA